MTELAIVNGPNLNLLGQRQPDMYGHASFDSVLDNLRREFLGCQLSYFQSNVEGELINELHRLHREGSCRGIVLNAGGYTHTSVALGDAVAGIAIPVIEVHISNVFARESFRHVSYLGAACAGNISGFGTDGYRMAVLQLIRLAQQGTLS